MTKDNILFGIVGLLLGLIIGFLFTNSINQRMAATGSITAPVTQNANTLPAGHPDIGSSKGAPAGGVQPEVQAAIDDARKQPDNFDAQVKAADLYNQIERFDGAIEFLKRANQLKPDNYEVVVHLGNANFDSDHYQEAEKWYMAALAKKPDDINVRTDLGLTFIFREPPNYDRAIQEFQRSLETDPNHIQTLQNLTVAYTKKGDAAKANATLAKLAGVDASNEAIPKLREDIKNIGVK
jgi:tetratricopeptide (TPR) repeat protein